MKATNLILTVWTAMIACSAVAYDAPVRNEPCKADVQRFCKGIEPGGGRIMKCMREHNDELSAECRERMKERHEERNDRREEGAHH